MDQNVRKFSDEELIAILDKRVELESLNEAEIIDFIREVMWRRLYLKYGASSMFDFLTRAHYHYAPAVAQKKLDAARLMQLFPEVKELIAAGEINLTQLGMLARALRQKPASPKVQKEILESMRGQTVRNTQIILNEALEIEVKEVPKVRVQSDGSVRVEMTFAKEDWEMIERAKDLISHSVPSGEWPEVLAFCARFTVAKKGFSAGTKSADNVNLTTDTKSEDPFNPTSDTKSGRNLNPTSDKEVKVRQCQGVSRASRRYVFQRDKSCRHRHADGSFCGSHYQLQVDHIISRWKGGSNEVENLQLLCGVHNRFKYEREVEESVFERPKNAYDVEFEAAKFSTLDLMGNRFVAENIDDYHLS